MHVEVIRSINSLSIRWDSGDDLWTVSKAFDEDTRMEPAKIKCSAGVPGEADQAHAAALATTLAERMDAVFIRYFDFDRVVISYDHTDDGAPAWIRGPVDGKIYVVKAPRRDRTVLNKGLSELRAIIPELDQQEREQLEDALTRALQELRKKL